jgi:hypothetical protein
MYTTSTVRLLQVLFEKSLMPEPCDKFGENLVYLFYGRAAYRLNKMSRQTEQIACAPAVLIFRPEAVASIRRVYPFDTGGYPHEFPALSDVDMEHFELSAVEHAEQTVRLFWSTKASYFWFQTADVVPAENLERGDVYARLYHGLLHLDSNADDRRGTIEISSVNAVEVTSKSLLGLVVCHDLMGREEVKSLKGVLVRSFPYRGGRAIEYFSELRMLVEGVLRDLGCL